MADIIKSYNDVTRRNKDMNDGTYAEVISANTANVTTKFRDVFESYVPGGKWSETKASGDLVYVDGNAASSSYLVISRDPLVAGTETSLTANSTFWFPTEIMLGLSMSQRTLGQEFSVEVVDTQTPLPDVLDLAIASITQTTTTLTVDTVDNHGLSVGKSIGIYGCSNQLANYPSLVVASVPSPTQFTVTAGPGGTIASQTITNPVGDKGFVYFRERLGRARNGFSEIFESATVTSASLYVRAESGDAFPSGTVAGNHSVTIGTTASAHLVNSAYQYTFSPTTEYRFVAQQERIQWSDVGIDASITQSTSRLIRSQVCPDPNLTYKLRFRFTNNKALTVPSAQVVSVTKTVSTTGTFVTATPHGLTTGDLVVYYGSSDPAAANFPALTLATAVTVVDATTFLAVIGSGTVGVAYGGFVAKVQGGNLGSALGYNAISATSATLSTLSDGTRQLTLTGSGSWVGLTIGDLVNVLGLRTTASLGLTSLGVDGAWKVANVVTTALTLVLPYADSMAVPADFGATPCGGGVIKRSDVRINSVRVSDFSRERVELLARPGGDVSLAAPVVIQGGALPIVSSVISAGTPTVPATPYFVNSAATTNGALILTGTSGLQAFYATNIGATAAFVKLYNKATAPTVGTDVPEMIIAVPAAVAGVPGAVEITPGFNGYRFALGLGIAITGAVADTDTTAVAAGQVKVKLSRTV